MPSSTAALSTLIPSHQHLVEIPIANPKNHSIGPKQRADIEAWFQQHEPDIGGLVFIFVFLLVLGGLWRLRSAVVEWVFERNRDKARIEWADRERRQRRTVVVVGILRKEKDGGSDGSGSGSGKGRVLKRVRFLDGEEFDGLDGLDGLGSRVVVVNDERAEALLEFLENGSVVGEVF
ncbi:uncharacterized protein RAG0_04484 [Rhynchosporium agropyri]|uniref:Uncharacterized protein n=1 Tax=Rhynchosporium agropyri TaxID=914238 RepID=A0A1E1K8Y0_9HELO|nr:uncharacterized protein RAG0_04484 [Rhynchosporium agropyri]